MKMLQLLILVSILSLSHLASAQSANVLRSVANYGEPLLKVTYHNTILNGATLANSPTLEVEVITIQEGAGRPITTRPGRKSMSEIELDIGFFTQRHPLFQYWISVEQGEPLDKGDLILRWADQRNRQEVQIINFVDAWMTGIKINPNGKATVTMSFDQVQFLAN